MENKDLNTIPDIEDRLDAVFASYRAACPDPEPGANFMPGLWQKIDSRRSFALSFGRWSRGLVTAGAAIAMLMAVLVGLPSRQNSAVYLATYVDVLDDDNRTDNPDFVEVGHRDSGRESAIR